MTVLRDEQAYHLVEEVVSRREEGGGCRTSGGHHGRVAISARRGLQPMHATEFVCSDASCGPNFPSFYHTDYHPPPRTVESLSTSPLHIGTDNITRSSYQNRNICIVFALGSFLWLRWSTRRSLNVLRLHGDVQRYPTLDASAEKTSRHKARPESERDRRSDVALRAQLSRLPAPCGPRRRPRPLSGMMHLARMRHRQPAPRPPPLCPRRPSPSPSTVLALCA